MLFFLRGLPSKYRNLVSSIKVCERLPEVEEVIQRVFHEAEAKPDDPESEARTMQCTHQNHEASRCWKLHRELAPVCDNDRQRGHVTRNCPQKREDANEVTQAYGPVEYVKRGAEDGYGELPPISL